jgi:hypothetical protein
MLNPKINDLNYLFANGKEEGERSSRHTHIEDAQKG